MAILSLSCCSLPRSFPSTVTTPPLQATTCRRHWMKKACASSSSSSSSSPPEPSSPSSSSPSPSPSAPAATASSPPPPPPKPALTLKKGEIVRVDKEKYLNSVEYLAVGHPVYYTGLDYIYEDRGEILDVRMFETGEYALISWAGIPTSPAWLPAYMLIKSAKLSYKRT